MATGRKTARVVSQEKAHRFVEALKRENPQPKSDLVVSDKDYRRLEKSLTVTLKNLIE